MKTFFIRLAKFTAFLIIALFLTVFIWANWEKPSPGQSAPVVDFIQYDVSKIADSTRIGNIQSDLNRLTGVRGTTYNPKSNLMVIAYGIDHTNRETIENNVFQNHAIRLSEKQFTQSGPKCPIDVAWISRTKKLLCVRD